MMMMIMIASFVDSITTPIKSWLDDTTTAHMTEKEVGVDSARADCIVCLSEVTLGDRYAILERCRHGFHVECVEAWLKDHPNCPLCRTPVSGADEYTHKPWFYLKKSYEIMTRFGFHSFAF
ncbi:putative transcription factor C2H2 family [Helianthus annuus]|uniref:Putative zinc finger, RING/FYVE/PHD-type n=1 Tax=Helianthus annuus TaxID=4232 RepID=A0A251U4H4_HELAN|nr:putative transcription factor C2H2 family [Helianthus annuus]KAJ0538465.1 putative transcription factor C2H2 family [Helianthus annuus]KAJ0546351.1 putative transcription factor C2H2 family [Helianthus annuus]KAJ0553095.1 putative transcription factor C2H2 family [Helianthus annuus]KAJ0718789.1 putative transcription factor C2H2 family [Helianthus annuus]